MNPMNDDLDEVEVRLNNLPGLVEVDEGVFGGTKVAWGLRMSSEVVCRRIF